VEVVAPDPVVEDSGCWGPEFCTGEYFFTFYWILSVWIDGADTADAARLYGYTATDAGCVLGPGAFVIVMLAPLVVEDFCRSWREALRWIRIISCLRWAMWHFASLYAGDGFYRMEGLARGVAGLGLRLVCAG